MKPYFSRNGVELFLGDNREVLPHLSGVDAVVTDPPYGLSFMGKRWDYDVPGLPTWELVFAAMKPGAHLLSFFGTRTYHRGVVNIEDAGFEIRDQIGWLYGSGFPKSLDVSKAIDKKRDDYDAICRVALWLRPFVARTGFDVVTAAFGFKDQTMARARWTSNSQPNVPTWEQWEKLKALCGFTEEMDAEVWRLNGRKGKPGEAWDQREVTGTREVPIGHAFAGEVYGNGAGEKSYNDTAPATEAARQWNGWGTALKPAWEPVVLARKPLIGTVAENVLEHGTGAINIDASRVPGTVQAGAGSPGFGQGREDGYSEGTGRVYQDTGRFPANIIHDGSDEVVGVFPETEPAKAAARGGTNPNPMDWGNARTDGGIVKGHDDTGGSAARFFYSAKADAEDRGEGNTHPTVKPIALMQYLVKMVTRPGGLILDPFAGSGSTLIAAQRAGFRAIGIEAEDKYCEIIARRLEAEGFDFGQGAA